MKLIGVQYDIAWEDKLANYAKVERLLDAAAPPAGSLIALPEMFATGFSMDAARIAEDAGGPIETFLAELARRHESYLVAGVVTRADGDRGRNQALVLDPTSAEVARYCKRHPFSFAGETEHYVPGGEVAVFPWGPFTVAPLVCYDLRFPETFRLAVDRGADLFVVIANWPDARAAHWTALLRARAIENQAYVLGVNRVGADPKNTYSGGATLFDPWGETVATAGAEETTIQGEPNAAAQATYRREFPALTDRRDP